MRVYILASLKKSIKLEAYGDTSGGACYVVGGCAIHTAVKCAGIVAPGERRGGVVTFDARQGAGQLTFER